MNPKFGNLELIKVKGADIQVGDVLLLTSRYCIVQRSYAGPRGQYLHIDIGVEEESPVFYPVVSDSDMLVWRCKL